MNIEYEVSECVLEEELENLVTHIAGLVCEGGEEGTPIKVGHIEASLVDVAESTEYDDIPLNELFFRGSPELAKIYDAFYKEDSPAYKHMESVFGWNMEIDYRNMLFIDLVTVMPAFRGRGISLLTIYRTIQRFAGDSMLVVLDPRPMQCRENRKAGLELGLNQYTTDFAKATARLKFYFELLGFRSVPDSYFLVLNLDHKRPRIGDFSYPAKLEEGVSIN